MAVLQIVQGDGATGTSFLEEQWWQIATQLGIPRSADTVGACVHGRMTGAAFSLIYHST